MGALPAALGNAETAAMFGGGGGIRETAGESRIVARQEEPAQVPGQHPVPGGSIQVACDLGRLGAGLEAFPPDFGAPPACGPGDHSLLACPSLIIHRGGPHP